MFKDHHQQLQQQQDLSLESTNQKPASQPMSVEEYLKTIDVNALPESPMFDMTEYLDRKS